MADSRAAASGERSFEDMLADPLEQFDLRSELLASIMAYITAPPATVGTRPWQPVATAHYPWLYTPTSTTGTTAA